jgi:hypothetical protein
MLPGKHGDVGMMYVVDIWNDGVRLKPKVFSALPEANTFAAAEVEEGRSAKVYEEPDADNAYEAAAALERGEGKLVAAPQHKATKDEIERAEREHAEQLKPRPLIRSMVDFDA